MPQPLRHGIVRCEARQHAEQPADLHRRDLRRAEDQAVRGDAAAAKLAEHRALTHGGAEHVQRYTQTENQNFPISHKRSPLFLLTSPLYRKSRRREETKIRKCQTNIKRDPLHLRSRLKRLRLAAAHSLRSHVCEPKSIFADAHVAGKNVLNSFCACGRKLCEARYWMFKLLLSRGGTLRRAAQRAWRP